MALKIISVFLLVVYFPFIENPNCVCSNKKKKHFVARI